MNRKTRLILFFIMQSVFFLGANFAHAVTPTFFQSLGLNNYMFGVALASMMIINFMVSPFWGKLNDFVSSRTSMLIGCIGYGIGQMMFGLATTEWQVIAARMFAGMFTAGSFVSILTYIVNTTKDERQRGYYLALSATLQSVCSAFGYLIGGLLGEISIWLVFVVQTATIIISGILLYIICENDAMEDTKGVTLSRILRESNPFSAFLASRDFMNTLLLSLFLVVILQNLGNTAFDQSFNYFLRDQFGFSSGYNGIIKGAMGLITLLVNSTITIWILNKSDIKKSIIWVFAVASSMMVAAIVFSKYPIPYIGVNVLYFAFTAITFPLLQNMVAKSATQRNSNLIMGFYNSMKSLGGIIGAMTAGFLYNEAPLYPFYLGLAAYVLACLFSWLYYKRSPSEIA